MSRLTLHGELADHPASPSGESTAFSVPLPAGVPYSPGHREELRQRTADLLGAIAGGIVLVRFSDEGRAP